MHIWTHALAVPGSPCSAFAQNRLQYLFKGYGSRESPSQRPCLLKAQQRFPAHSRCVPGTSQAPSVPPGSTRGSSLCHRRRLPQPGGHTPPSPHPPPSACPSTQSRPTRHTHQQHPSPSCPFLLHHKALPSNLRHRRNIHLIWHLSPLLEDKLPWAGTRPIPLTAPHGAWHAMDVSAVGLGGSPGETPHCPPSTILWRAACLLTNHAVMSAEFSHFNDCSVTKSQTCLAYDCEFHANDMLGFTVEIQAARGLSTTDRSSCSSAGTQNSTFSFDFSSF